MLDERVSPPLMHENHQVLREALGNVCELLGGMTAWLARHDGAGHHTLVRMDPAFGIDPDVHTALEIMAVTWPQEAVHVKPWRGYTLLFTSFPARRDARGRLYSLGILFMGCIELTERRAAVVEGLRSSLQALFSRSLQDTSSNPSTTMPAPSVVCSCCRRTSVPQHGWIHWDDLRLIETGFASTHTVCERCAADLYANVLNAGE